MSRMKMGTRVLEELRQFYKDRCVYGMGLKDHGAGSAAARRGTSALDGTGLSRYQASERRADDQSRMDDFIARWRDGRPGSG